MVFSESSGSDEICPVCYWQDDIFGLLEPFVAMGPNHVSLAQAQKNFGELGFSEPRFARLKNRLSPPSQFAIDPEWRPILSPEKFHPGQFRPEKGSPYYWRSDYWLA